MLVFGVYLMVLGVVTSVTTDNDIPVAIATADSCEAVGSINEHDSGSFYCTPSDTDELAWASAADFNAHHKAEVKKLEEAAEQEAQAAAAKHEEELAAAEKHADVAETALQEYQDEAEAVQEKERQRQQEAA